MILNCSPSRQRFRKSKQRRRRWFGALKAGENKLHQLHEENTVEDILKLMEEVEEQNEMEREVNEILIWSSIANSLSSDELMEVKEKLAVLKEKSLGKRTMMIYSYLMCRMSSYLWLVKQKNGWGFLSTTNTYCIGLLMILSIVNVANYVILVK